MTMPMNAVRIAGERRAAARSRCGCRPYPAATPTPPKSNVRASRELRRREPGGRVRADRVEGDVAEVEQARVADDDVQTERHHHVDRPSRPRCRRVGNAPKMRHRRAGCRRRTDTERRREHEHGRGVKRPGVPFRNVRRRSTGSRRGREDESATQASRPRSRRCEQRATRTADADGLEALTADPCQRQRRLRARRQAVPAPPPRSSRDCRDSGSSTTLAALGRPFAEQALGPEDEDQDQDREDDRLRPVAARRVPGETLR